MSACEPCAMTGAMSCQCGLATPYAPEGMRTILQTSGGAVFRRKAHKCDPPAPETGTLQVGDIFGCACGKQLVLTEQHEIYGGGNRHWSPR